MPASAIRTRVAGIMAAGEGTRLKECADSKALALVAGKALIDHVLDQCVDAGIETVHVGLRPGNEELAVHLSAEGRFTRGVHCLPVAPGGATGDTFQALLGALEPGPCLISTVDTIEPRSAYRRLLNHLGKLPADTLALVMATSYICDEKPIWIAVDEQNRVTNMAKGIAPTGLVFGNVRWLSDRARHEVSQMEIEAGSRDVEIMQRLLGYRSDGTYVYKEDPVFDVDDCGDLDVAEGWVSGHSGSGTDGGE